MATALVVVASVAFSSLLCGCLTDVDESRDLEEVYASQAARDKRDKKATSCDFGADPIEYGTSYSVSVLDSDLKDDKRYAVEVTLGGLTESLSDSVVPEDGRLFVELAPWAVGAGELSTFEVKEKKGELELKLKAQCTFEVVEGCTRNACEPGQCQTVDDGCGGTVDCGSCSAGFFCGDGNTCDVCGPLECAPNQCGFVDNECGSLDCGSCAEGEVCNQRNECEVDIASQRWCIGEDTDEPPDETVFGMCTICGLRNLKVENWDDDGVCMQAWRRVAWESNDSPECRQTAEDMRETCCGDYPQHPARVQCVQQPGPYEPVDLCADGCFPSDPARAGIYSLNAGGPLAPWVKSLGDRRGTCYQDDGAATGGLVWTCRRAYYLLKYGHLPPAQAREVVSWWRGGHALSANCGCDGENTNNPANP